MFTKLTKIKAGALQYVLVISVIIAILLLTFILLVNLQKQTSIKHTFYKQAIYNVNYGFDYLANRNIEYDQVISKQFSDNTQESTSILKKKWGLFDLAIITSKVGKEFYHKIGLLGWKQRKIKALHLQDNNTPLVMVGNSKIIGNAHLPKQGVKIGSIGGTSFYGNKLIEGVVNTSTNKLPEITNYKSIEAILEYAYINDSIQGLELEEGLIKVQSFNQNTLLYEINSDMLLHNIMLKGNIIIKSDKKITIAASAKLNDIILIAPEIEVESNVVGNFQAFATQMITVHKNCKIKYPSSLVLLDNNKEKENKIELKEEVAFKGVIIYMSDNKDQVRYTPQVVIKENVVVTGEIYCEENLELLGKVKGSVITKNFITNQLGSTYINHIYNGIINIKELPKEYVGLKLESDHQNVAKWLY